MAGTNFRATLVALLAVFIATTYGPDAFRAFKTLGVRRHLENTVIANAADFVKIEDTAQCEDVHFHETSGLLFTACEDTVVPRSKWFPPLANFADPGVVGNAQGSIHIIDPKTLKSKRLGIQGYDGPFVTHGIDIVADPKEPKDAIYIFAVNHVPNPEYVLAAKVGKASQNAESIPEKSHSRIELFHYVLGDSSVKHVRTISHPLIQTPNDIYAVSPSSIFVTNDHFYREGHMRALEDVLFRAKWSTTVHLQISDLTATDATAGVTGRVAVENLHNNNGLGHGRAADEILIASCVSGTMHIGKLPADPTTANITIVEDVTVDTIVDNPTYFSDPYAKPGDDRSGYLLPGLSHAINIGHNIFDHEAVDGTMVYFVQKDPKTGAWNERLIFADDGHRIRSVSASVLVAIDPAENGGKRQGWLFVTGFVSSNMIAVKVDL
ncbi:hypothetical protein jhhlp_000790 [Lomentospora prolificans]|uniref:Serum paraoxonase/arylesterase family protein n=1 Tax=Lomentospora prolificans TaxID=41688 RepID=A0A2N3NJQ9_9PEZI|nr:hypothetical protein jhhlp_000790 [Lomentospora prolificans]